MKRVIIHTPITKTLHRAQCSSSAVLCLFASKILRRRVTERVYKLHNRFRLNLAYSLKALKHQIDIFIESLTHARFASFELSFYYMHSQNPLVR